MRIIIKRRALIKLPCIHGSTHLVTEPQYRRHQVTRATVASCRHVIMHLAILIGQYNLHTTTHLKHYVTIPPYTHAPDTPFTHATSYHHISVHPSTWHSSPAKFHTTTHLEQHATILPYTHAPITVPVAATVLASHRHAI